MTDSEMDALRKEMCAQMGVDPAGVSLPSAALVGEIQALSAQVRGLQVALTNTPAGMGAAQRAEMCRLMGVDPAKL